MTKKFSHIILSRSKNEYAESLSASMPNSTVVYDDLLSDESMREKGFCNMTKSIKSPCSWEKSFYILNNSDLNAFEYFVFIEDDVFSRDINRFKSFEERLYLTKFDLLTHEIKSKEESEDWYWWRANDKNYFKKPIKSFNPFCILSRRLVQSVLAYRCKVNTFVFHEIMFCSIAEASNYTAISIETLPFYEEYFGSFFWRPAIEENQVSDDRIYHPLKPKYE